MADVLESIGTKPKTWLVEPDSGLWLFKASRVRAHEPSGEDWAEKVASEIAKLLGVPHATIELAHRSGTRGVISATFVAKESYLVHGNELLSAKDIDYPQDERSNDTPGYTIASIKEALKGVAKPDQQANEPAIPPEAEAFEWFAGYLVLDAWINNTDRHHMNWGVITPDNRLAPSFDHGSSLAFGETEARRARLLGPEGTSAAEWLERGRAKPFQGMPSMISVATEALERCSEVNRTGWISRLEQVDLTVVDSIIDKVPETGPSGTIMSDTARTLCKEILRINRERLLNVIASH